MSKLRDLWEIGEGTGVERVGVLCSGCLGRAPPFVGLVGEGEYRGALREYREGLGSRFDPFDDEVMWALEGSDGALRGSDYVGGGELGGVYATLQGAGFFLSPLCVLILVGVIVVNIQ